MIENNNQIEFNSIHSQNLPFSLEGHWQPWYDDRRDYNTNAPSYYDYLANVNKLLNIVIEKTNKLLRQNVNVEDTSSVDLTKIGDWTVEDYTDVITLKADVLLSALKEETTFDEISYNLKNSLKINNDGLFSADLTPILSDLNNKLDNTISRVETNENNITKLFNKYETFPQTVHSFSEQAIFVPSKDGLPWFDQSRLTINFNCITDSCFVNKGAHSYALPRGASLKIDPTEGSTRLIALNTETNELKTIISYNDTDVNPDLNENIVVIGSYRINNDGTYSWGFPIMTLNNPLHNKHYLPKFGAHRGMNKYAPESTKSAYYLATLYGFDVWEGDVRLTKDNVPVIFHDDEINNYATMADGGEIPTTVKISETNYADLTKFDFGVKKHSYYKGEKILSFNDFCRYMRVYNCQEAHIEFKYDNNWTSDKVKIVKDIADSERVTDKIVFSSFYPDNGLKQLYELDNNVRIEYIMYNLSDNEDKIRTFNTTYANAKQIGLTFSATQTTSAGYFMARAINKHFTMSCWVVDKQSDFENMRGLPLDLVLTDGWVGVYGLNIL